MFSQAFETFYCCGKADSAARRDTHTDMKTLRFIAFPESDIPPSRNTEHRPSNNPCRASFHFIYCRNDKFAFVRNKDET